LTFTEIITKIMRTIFVYISKVIYCDQKLM
jgi:hypothetical protein